MIRSARLKEQRRGGGQRARSAADEAPAASAATG